MIDASVRASGYAIMIEETNERKLLASERHSPQEPLDQESSDRLNWKCQFIDKDFSAVYHASLSTTISL